MPMPRRHRNIIQGSNSTERQSWTEAGLAARFTIVCSFVLVFTTRVTCQNATNFTFTSFDADSVTLVADARVKRCRIRLANISADAIETQAVSTGRALYRDAVQLRDSITKTVASFQTSFTFSIDTNTSEYNADEQTSGLAWGLFPDNTTIDDIGRYLGLMNYTTDNFLTNHVFAVEVDTGYSNFGPFRDVSSCHLGMGLITMNSKPVFDMADPPGSNVSRCIEDRGVHTLDVNYNGISHRLVVSLLDISAVSIANLSTTVDLYPYLNDVMFVGFSSSALYFRPHVITVLSWDFSSTFDAPAAAPVASAPAKSPAPSPKSPAPSPGPAAVYSPAGGDLGAPDESSICLRNLTSGSSPPSKSNNVIAYGAAAGGAGGAEALLLLLELVMGCMCVRRSSKANRNRTFDQEAIPGGVAVVGPRRFSYKEHSKATKNFNKTELLGQGGSGSVYRGGLQDSGALVAVKMIQAERSREMAEEFQAEVSIINQIRHRNLVQLQGWCNEKGMLCLVYEYLPNGSLDGLLRKEMQAPNTVLPRGTRFNILTGVAAALAYLHEEIGQCILHRDLKPGNVLLDVNYNACLADFGLARLIEHDQVAPTTMLAGTMGYMAHELPHTGRATTQSDVYAFRVLILEMICERRPTDIDRETQMMLLDCVWAAHASNDILCIVDAKIREDSLNRQIECTLLLGLLCYHLDPACKPSMRNARQILTGDSPLPAVPSEKPVVYSRSPYELDLSFDDEPPLLSNYSSKGSSNYNTHDYDDNNNSFSSQSRSFL